MSAPSIIGLQPMRVITHIDDAIQHTTQILFRPFSAGKWLMFGIIIFLANLLRGGAGYGNFSSFNHSHGTSHHRDFVQIFDGVNGWFASHLLMVILIAIPVMLVMLALSFLFIWLRSRGEMMFIRAVALDDERIGENWSHVAAPARSLLYFRFCLALIGWVIFLPTLAWAYFIAQTLVHQGSLTMPVVVTALVPIGVFSILIMLAFSLVSVLQTCFVSPLMLRFDLPCLKAWSVFLSLLPGNVLAIVGFLLLRLLYSCLAGVAALFIGCLTCCIGFLPVISQAVLSPYYVFDRSFSLFILQDLGPEFTFVAGQEPLADSVEQ